MASHLSIGPAGPTYHGQTLEQHVLAMQRRTPEATGDLTGLFHQLSLAAKIIGSQVSKAGLAGLLGLTGDENVQGEEVQKLDVFANNTIIRCVCQGGHVCVMGSEEIAEPIPVEAPYEQGKYVLQFDPLDGSGNIDINASIGTIFSIHRRITPSGPGTLEDCLQRGRDIVAAGYVIYGSSNMFVYSAGHGVHGFTLDPAIGEFFLSHENLRVPESGDTYSVNEGNYHRWAKGVQRWADAMKGGANASGKRLRYIGAMVADLHQTLLRGGIFAYPADRKNASGKLRLLYEAAPFAFLMEQAGGKASSGEGPIMDITPTSLHQRTPLYIGSPRDVDEALAHVRTST
ncbi:MAG: class 1 fructose-bisphosphatase [Myxococcota bacterium]